MEECFKCHAPETRALLFEVISPEGIMKICGRCYGKENLPLLSQKSGVNPEKEQGVYERMLKVSGYGENIKNPSEKTPQNTSLKKIVDETFERGTRDFRNDAEAKKDLVYNFHWVVLRGRRHKHFSQEKLAREIHEPERVIKLIEKGYVPKNMGIIKKLEQFLGIQIRKESSEQEKTEGGRMKKPLFEDEEMQERDSRGKELDLKNPEKLTIADLQEMKRKKDEEMP